MMSPYTFNHMGFSGGFGPSFMHGWFGFAPAMGVLAGLLVLAGIIIWVWALVHALRHQREWKLLAWVMVIVFLRFIGAILYLAIAYNREKKHNHQHHESDNK